MNIQEAYNKGLDDAEQVVIEKLQALIDESDTTPFNNPELERIRQVLLNRPVKDDEAFLDFLEKSFLEKRDKRLKLPISEFEDRKFKIASSVSIMTDYFWDNSWRKHTAAKHLANILKACIKAIKG